MKLKNISRLLIFGVLLNSIPINSFAGVLSEDTRYETFTDNNISIPNILEEEKIDVKIEGNTLVNLMPPITINKVHWRDSNYMVTGVHTGHNFEFNSINQSWKWDIGSCTNNIFPLIKLPTELMIEGKEYSLIVDSTDFITEIKNTNLDYLNNDEGVRLDDIQKGRNIINFTYNSEYKNIVFGQFTPSSSVKILSNFMILEGDWTNREIPEYFEGLQSSFEDQLVTQEMVDLGEEKVENLGKYKVEVKSTGKNKFNKWFSGNIGLDGEIYEDDKYVHSDYIPVNSNTAYTTSNEGALRASHWFFYDINKVLISATDRGESLYTVVTPDNCKFVRVLGYTTNRDKFQLEEGSVATAYEPYKEFTNTFYLNSPLLKGDTIEIINGQATHVHRSGKVVLDGSNDEKWYDNYTDYPNCTTHRFNGPSNAPGGYRDTTNNDGKDFIITDKLPWIGAWSNTSEYGISRTGNSIYIYNASINTVNELRKWLSENPVTVVYKLANPIYEPIKANLSVNLFEGATHISNNSNIPATMEVTVDRTLNRAVEYTTLAKTNPTVENLSRARMWTNLVKESIKKDQLQEEVNSITKLNDMELERKTATSNLDLYIKSENILSMALDTNSIVFEDFSGVEDMAKENAVNISINSSLPYQLNAYMPVEIQNSDKSNTINKSILNIKENSETAYQTFANTTDKIVLKDNCNGGNDLIHNIDIKLKGSIAHQKDVYKTTIKFEAEQK